MVKSGLRCLKKEIEKWTKIKTNEIVNLVKMIFEFNNQNQKEKGLKILKPDQMISRLPISLWQFKAVNNLEKLKNEIRQLLYSLYHSKKLTKTIYNNLINTI